jgi:U3 small nucleolar RNA-associated protein 23
MIKDADRFKMDLVGGLERTLHGQVKPSMLLTSTANLEPHANEDSGNPMLNATSVCRS